jgi:hypothetical protein
MVFSLVACSGSGNDSIPRYNAKIYSFSGGNEFIEINNGMIVITDELESFIGGDLFFRGEKPANVVLYSEKFFFYMDDGSENAIQNNIVSIEGAEEGISINPNTGTTTAEKILNADVWDMLINSLNFTLSGTFVSGENFEYHIVLDVNEIF